MKVKASSVFYAIIMGLLLVFSYSCEKDESNESKGAAGTFTDKRDGNVYKFVTIGDQVWMAENLKYLPEVVGPTTKSLTNPFYYVNGYGLRDVNEAKGTFNYSTYGVLYNWPAAMAGSASSKAIPSGVQGACPAGWHLPSDAEWTQLTDYLGGEAVAGGKLKETGTVHWTSPNEGATNETGFTALPSEGKRNAFDEFGGGESGYWWCASEFSPNFAVYRPMYTDYSSVVSRIYGNKDFGMSVRCVRD